MRERSIGDNFSKDHGAESKFSTHNKLIVVNMLKHKYWVDRSRYLSRDHFVKKI